MFNENDLTVENMKFLSREAELKEKTRVLELKNKVISSAFNSVKSKLANEFGTSITLDSPKTNLTEFTPNTLSGKIIATLSVDTIDGIKRVPVTFKVRASVSTLAESIDEIKDKLDATEGSLESEIREIMASQEDKLKAKEEEDKLAKQVEADIMNGISAEASKQNHIFKEAKKEEIDMHVIQENPVGNALPPQIINYPKAYLPEMKINKSIINVGGFKYKYIGDEPTITGDTENGVIARFSLIPMGKKASLKKVAFGEINESNFSEMMLNSFNEIKDYDTAAKLAEQLAEENNNLRNHNGTLYLVGEDDLTILDKFEWDLLNFTVDTEASVKTQAAEDQTVEGWSNYNTWNVALWIDNTRPLYEKMVEYVNQEENPTYDGLIDFMGLTNEYTGDKVSYQAEDLNKSELDKWVKNYKDELGDVNASLETEASLEKSAADYSSMTSSELKDFVKPYAKSNQPLPKDLADAIAFFPSVVSDYASQFKEIGELETKLTDEMKDAITRNSKEAFNIFNKLSKGKDFDSFPDFIKNPILDDMDVLQNLAQKNPNSLSESLVNAISKNPSVMLDLVDNGNINLPEEVKETFNDKLKELGYSETGFVEEKPQLTPEQQQAQKDMKKDQEEQKGNDEENN